MKAVSVITTRDPNDECPGCHGYNWQRIARYRWQCGTCTPWTPTGAASMSTPPPDQNPCRHWFERDDANEWRCGRCGLSLRAYQGALIPPEQPA